MVLTTQCPECKSFKIKAKGFRYRIKIAGIWCLAAMAEVFLFGVFPSNKLMGCVFMGLALTISLFKFYGAWVNKISKGKCMRCNHHFLFQEMSADEYEPKYKLTNGAMKRSIVNIQVKLNSLHLRRPGSAQ